MEKGNAEAIEREFSAGGVVFKKGDKGQPLFLVTKSTPTKSFPKSVWRLPKGWLDDDGEERGELALGRKKATQEQMEKSALREVEEEGGVKANIVKKIGTEMYFRKNKDKKIMKFVTFFLMEWENDIKEGPGIETEEVLWLSYSEARKKLDYSTEKKVLEKAVKLLKKPKSLV